MRIDAYPVDSSHSRRTMSTGIVDMGEAAKAGCHGRTNIGCNTVCLVQSRGGVVFAVTLAGTCQ